MRSLRLILQAPRSAEHALTDNQVRKRLEAPSIDAVLFALRLRLSRHSLVLRRTAESTAVAGTIAVAANARVANVAVIALVARGTIAFTALATRTVAGAATLHLRRQALATRFALAGVMLVGRCGEQRLHRGHHVW